MASRSMPTLLEGVSRLFIISAMDSSFKAPKFWIISQVISADLRWRKRDNSDEAMSCLFYKLTMRRTTGPVNTLKLLRFIYFKK